VLPGDCDGEAGSLTPAEALGLADRAVSAVGGAVWVQGEVEGLHQSSAGHLYCTLAGDGARLSVCAFGRYARAIVGELASVGVTMANGQAVRLKGRLGCYVARGTVELRAIAIDPAVTVGAAETARRRLRQILMNERLMERQQDMELPWVPLRVWLIGPEGDGIEDFLGVLASSPWAWSVIFVPTVSEGPGASGAIAEAVLAAPPATQVIVLARGGGAAATEAYDTERVARSICAARRPVITAVGHTLDCSIADQCAWTSAPTPTAAAELLCQQVALTAARIDDKLRSIGDAAGTSLASLRADLDRRRHAIAGAAADATARSQLAVAEASARRARHVTTVVVILAVLLAAIVLIGVLR
jgi:exodeoxyribonuclease VII large subunit